MAVVTGVLDVMCVVGVVGVALVTGMADVAHAGNREGLRRWESPLGQKVLGGGRPGRPARERAGGLRPGQGGRPQAPGKGDGV
ncbi:hypothetical protein ACWD6P_21285 [Streptomyces sp. NPDC002446]